MDCVLCHAPADDPHHVRTHRFGSGTGIKPDDVYVIPICRPCHRLIEANPVTYKEDQIFWVAQTLAFAIKDRYFIESWATHE